MSTTEPNSAPQARFRIFSPVSFERRQTVLRDIAAGSDPRLMYYALLGASVVIAAFGLLANSPAVVIGAMLVSPLMMPIFGICVGLSRGDGRLLRSAMISEFSGVALAVTLAFLLGNLPLSFEATPEMLARTSPNLLDLFVAAFAGLAGCLAMLDERVSPALPGVAISTSLTPPLATSGLCLAFGSYAGAWGAFLLFFANFLAILAVATVIFVAAGFVYKWELGSVSSMTRRFASPVIGLLAVTVLLTQQLLLVAEQRATAATIRSVLEDKLRDDPSISIVAIDHDDVRGGLEVLATIRSARVLSPKTVQDIETLLVDRLGEKVALFFRCTITKDVGAAGSANLLDEAALDGGFTVAGESNAARVVQVAEQAIRDVLVDRPDIVLEDVSSTELPIGQVVIASIQTSRRPVAIQVQRVEALIRRRLGRNDVSLLVRSIDATDTTAKGRVLLGHSHFSRLSEDDKALAGRLDQAARTQIEKDGTLFVTSLDAARLGERWAVRAEVVGPEVPSPALVKTIEDHLAKEAGAPVDLLLWARTDVVVSRSRYDSVERLVEERVRKGIVGSDAAEGMPADE